MSTVLSFDPDVTAMLGGLALLVSSASTATDISVALGHSADSTMTYRVGLQFPGNKVGLTPILADSAAIGRWLYLLGK